MARAVFQRQKDRKPEAVFASAVMRQLRTLYGSRMWETAFPGGLGSRSGIPDRLICIDGRFVALEFKNPDGNGRIGPKQRIELAALNSAGAIALIVSSAQDLDPLFSALPPTQRILRRGQA
jgi:hypothetical protein